MLSKWKVRTVEVAGATFYEVYRTTDSAKAIRGTADIGRQKKRLRSSRIV